VIAVCYVASLHVLQLVSLRFQSTDFKEPEMVVLRHDIELRCRFIDQLQRLSASPRRRPRTAEPPPVD